MKRKIAIAAGILVTAVSTISGSYAYYQDSVTVTNHCDGSIMVIESGVISYRFAQEVKSQLERSNCPLLGVVLNKVDMQKQAYGKYGKYGQYKYGDYGQEEDD